MRKLLVTGTDTNVGKTVVSAALFLHARQQGLEVRYVKPAETGCHFTDGSQVCGDVEFLRETTHCVIEPPLYCFSPPSAPAVAAAEAGVEISLESVRRQVDKQSADLVLIEGAGGLLVPVTPKLTYGDLARELRWPILIVARSGLGTINHTLLTIEAAKQRGLRIVGVVLNSPTSDEAALASSNAAQIERISSVPVLGAVAHRKQLDADTLLDAARDVDWSPALQA